MIFLWRYIVVILTSELKWKSMMLSVNFVLQDIFQKSIMFYVKHQLVRKI